MKKHSLLTLSFLMIISLASCGEDKPVTSSEAGGDTTSSSQAGGNSSSSQNENVITESNLAKGQTTYTDTKGNQLNLTRSGIYKASGAPHVNSHPDNGVKQKLLVAPISFQADSSDKNWIDPTDALLTKINKTFTASDEELKQLSGSAITSVQSFYEQSSFGKGAFDVVVLPTWIEYNGTAAQFQSRANGGAGVSMSSYVRDWYIAEYNKTDHGKLGADWQYSWKDFDTDYDGYLDLIWQVYAYNYNNSDTSFWWAYVTYTSNQPNYTDPTIMTLAWASTQFMDSYNGYDPHTFIHETGHTLGINDFYDYTNTWKPIGSVDYMDQNLGDHSAYTKFCYGWINPYVLREEDLEGGKTAEITLRAGTTSGDALVLASPNYNGTAYDEYLMVELMGPYGLATRDYNSGYSNTTGYKEAGIRITHVDARMWQNSHDETVSDPNSLGVDGGDNRTCNTYGGRMGVKYDSDFWPAEKSGSVPTNIKKNHPDAKIGGIGKLNGANNSTINAYFTEISLMESTIGATNWTNSSHFNASSDTTLFKEGQRFNLVNSKGAASAWAKNFMPSGSNLWNKAKTTLGWSGNDMYYEIDEDIACNFNLRVTEIDEDSTYGAVAKLTITLN